MSYIIVVARYNENIEWLNNEMENCIIYNKGNKLNIKNEIMLENVGRESESYLQYIIKNYHNLPDVIVFTQAKISDHKFINPKNLNDINYIINIKNEALQYSESQNYYLHESILEIIDNCWNKEWNLINGEYFLKDNYKNNKCLKIF